MAQEATLRAILKSKLRGLLARNKPWESTGAVLKIGETGVRLKFQSRTFKVARFCARKRVDPKDVVSVGSNPTSCLDMGADTLPSFMSGRDVAGASRPAQGVAPGTFPVFPPPSESLEGDSGSLRGPSPCLSVQSPPSPSLSIRRPPADRFSDEHCVVLDEAQCSSQDTDTRARDQVHRLCRSRGCAKKDF